MLGTLISARSGRASTSIPCDPTMPTEHLSTALAALPSAARHVFMNIGSNIDPLLPPDGDESVVSIAFEPIVSNRIPPSRGLFVVAAAVSNFSGMAQMGVYNDRGLSSSLAKPAWSGLLTDEHAPQLVPVISMSTVLASLPSRIDVWFLKTDMQGHDFIALSSTGALLRQRVHYIMSETAVNNVHAYNGTANDLCRDHLPFMRANGFKMLGMCKPCKAAFSSRAGGRKRQAQRPSLSEIDRFCFLQRRNKARPGLAERDVWWKRVDTTLPPPPSTEWWKEPS